MPNSGSQNLTGCTGILYDNGGQGNYTSNVDATTVISATGASSLTLTFNVFDIEPNSTCDYDWIKIYDGPSTSSALLGKYCNTTGSPGVITTSTSSVTIEQHSDVNTELQGFEMEWQCNYTSQPPTANFSASSTVSCSATIDFNDLSLNSPSSWTWYFGDGTSSIQQNPTHSYASNGTYDVKLVCFNAYGGDSLTQNSYITINSPVAPTVTDAERCSSGQLVLGANGTGTINWYDSQTATTALNTGNTYTTPIISTSTVYYAEDVVSGPIVNGGNTESNTNGSIYSSAYEHGIIFDCTNNSTLVSVEVNASTAGDRIIELQNSVGTVIDQHTVNIPVGISRITLDFDIPIGTDHKLVGPISPDLYRNNAGCAYPYSVGTDITLTRSDATSSTSYYYYFYDWEVTSQKCYSSRVAANADIILPANINISANGSTTICNGDSVTLTATTGASSYLWSPNNETTQSIVVSSAGNYYATYITDSCSSNTNTISVSLLNNNPIAEFTYSSNGLTVNFTDQSQYPGNYYWDFGDGTNSSIQNPIHTYSSNGTYTVELIVDNSCGIDTFIQIINVTSVGVFNTSTNKDISVYPNPSHSVITIESTGISINNLEMFDIYGRKVKELKVNNNKFNVNISELSKGIYFVKLKTDNGIIINKVIKE